MKKLLLLVMLLVAQTAFAHKPSDSYLSLAVEGSHVIGQWDIALRDLDFALGLDLNGDGKITWGEVRAKHNEIDAYALARLKLEAGNAQCPARVTDHLIDDHTDGAYAVLRFAAQCPAPITALKANYSLFFELDPQHKGLLKLQHQENSSSAIFTAEATARTFSLAEKQSKLRQFLDYCWEGIWHIWIGFDHILFLIALLLPAVVYRRHNRWQAVSDFKLAFVQVLKIVTAFTLAHSITLSLATLELISLPSRLVESTIAASVVFVALNNIFPFFQERRWTIAFTFGLIHGFGFASVLGDLGLPANAQLLALLGFNVGVEVGQLAIVAAFLPIAFLLRNTTFYRYVILTVGSILIAMLALAWFIERAFNLEFLPF